MSKKYIKLVWVFAICLPILSCDKEIQESHYSEVIDITANNDVGDELGIYSNHFKRYKGNVNIRRTSPGNTSSRINAWFLGDKNTASLSNGGDYFVNDLSLKFAEKRYAASDLTQKEINQYLENFIFGKEVNFSNKRDKKDIFKVPLYIPELIQISGTEDKIAETNLIRINRESYSFRYNKDDKNDNGLLILLSFNGESYDMNLGDFQPTASEIIFRAVHVKNSDAGEVDIPSELFEGIPSNGIVTLYIGRGNGKVIKYNDEGHYVRAFTQQQIRGVIN